MDERDFFGKDLSPAEFFKRLIKYERYTQEQFAYRIGYPSQQHIAQLLAAERFSVDNAIRFCEALGYDVIVAKKRPGRKMTDAHYLNEIVDYERNMQND